MAPVSSLSARRLKQLKKPLKNLPERVNIASRGGVVVFGPHVEARKLSVEYMRPMKGYSPPKWYTKVDRFRAEHIAYAYALLTHSPHDDATRTAYAHLVAETLKQYEFVKKTDLKVEWIPDGVNPYEETPRLAILDVIENNHLWLYPTMNGFGNEAADEYFEDHPLLDETDEFIDGRRLVVNDVFRIVHDYFGHIKEGVGFRADGEENAWRNHAAMYSEKALGAITTELRGQNSWVNFNEMWGEHNRTATAAHVKYAKQKVGLLPSWMWHEGRLDPH